MEKVLMLNSKTLEFTEVELKSNKVSLGEMYENIGCLHVEHMSGYNRELDEMQIGMWVDEEYKLHEDWMEDISLVFVNKSGRIIELVAGNIMFTYDGKDGETYGLSDVQIKNIKELICDVKAVINVENRIVKMIVC